MNTYAAALATGAGWVGCLWPTPDLAGRPLYESETLCRSAEEAEYVACREWGEVSRLPVLTVADLREGR